MQLKKEQPNFDFGVLPEVEQQIPDEFGSALDDLLSKVSGASGKIRFATLALLT